MESEQATPVGHSSKFHEGSQVRQTPEEGRRTYWMKHCGNNNKDEDNSRKKLNDKKITIGKSGQKELLVFYGQLNRYIFHTFHNKNGFHIHCVDYHFL